MDGYYVVYFTGNAGMGFGMLTFKDGIITGADASGGIYDGTYTQEGQRLVGAVKVEVPAGGVLVTGASAGQTPLAFTIPFNLASGLDSSQPIPMQTPTGPINVMFKKVRNAA